MLGKTTPHLVYLFISSTLLLSTELSATDAYSIDAPSTAFQLSETAAQAPTLSRAQQRLAFSKPYKNVVRSDKMNYRLGQAVFEKLWVAAPSSTTASDGLGPLYNARSCAQCHPRNGRGRMELTRKQHTPHTLVFHLSNVQKSQAQPAFKAPLPTIMDPTAIQVQTPDPVYGNQLQGFSVANILAEAQVKIDYTYTNIRLRDGLQVELAEPNYRFVDLAHGPFNENTRFSPRLAPSVYGLGILEAIDAEDILAYADAEDTNQDGISGKPNWGWSLETNTFALGRFGLKAGHPSIRQQNAAALNLDLGLSSALIPQDAGDCTLNQPICRPKLLSGSTKEQTLEVPHELTEVLHTYIAQTQAPLARHQQDPDVIEGKGIFHDIGCHSCHRAHYPSLVALDPHTVGSTEPYTDLLVHDMGPDLADGRNEFSASGQEWRTAPLWGIGLTRSALGYENYLHDGRARSLLEAILWHGGEAKPHQQAVIALNTHQRNALITFLESL